ncbi:MAG: copper-translocating P-type ATPase [Cyanobacteria bacterium NC_groundwater_1444_Ag_S-0.65um_54_12]|nr:copper-translocating P-type ATPase [Cyanobacteria bacterium NC_groundwater_1444_Ag_S-0.65um_54_12]
MAVNLMPPAVEKVTLKIGGMSCASCSATIEQALLRAKGVTAAAVSFAAESATISFLADQIDPDQLTDIIEQAGYQAQLAAPGGFPAIPAPAASARHDQERMNRLRLRSGIPLAFLLVLLSSGEMLPELASWYPWLAASKSLNIILGLLTLPIMFWVGWPFHRGAWHALLRRSATMDTLVSLGTNAAFWYSVVLTLFPGWLQASASMHGAVHVYYDGVAVIIVLILLGKQLEAIAKRHASAAIRQLVALRPPTARVLRTAGEQEIPVDDLQIGDRMIIRPGERIPTDGLVSEGTSSIDQSMLTGESIPVSCGPGDVVIGGTLNSNGALVVEATRVGAGTTLAGIIDLVTAAQASRAPIQRVADRFVGVFVPVIIALSVSTFLVWYLVSGQSGSAMALANAVAVLIIACPCAMGLATPISIMVGTGKGAQLGILFKNAEALETLCRVKTVVFDKTGTLTRGQPRVSEIVPIAPYTATDLLGLAASAEARSEHPLGQAIVRESTERQLELMPVEQFSSEPGRGLTAQLAGQQVLIGTGHYLAAAGWQDSAMLATAERLAAAGHTPVLVAIAGKPAGVIGLRDLPRPEARETIAALRQLGLQVVMLTGDRHQTARAMAHELGISQVRAEVLPADKAAAIQQLQAEHGMVAMIGDGVNDAPALATADVGIAIGTGTDVAVAVSGVTLLADDLRTVAAAIKLARATLSNIKQNLFWAFAYNISGIPLAAGVLYPAFHLLLSPAIAGGAMALSSLSVVLNALRLKRFNS